MNAPIPQAALRARSVGDIAATLPGATAIFRKFKIDFCCNGHLALADAAGQRGADLEAIERELDELGTQARSDADPAAMGSPELIDLIETRYPAAHRRAVAELISLSLKVESVHREHPKVPAGLARVLQGLQDALEPHLSQEQTVVYPAMRQAGPQNVAVLIEGPRHEHDAQAAALRRIESLTDDFALPDGACRSWQALYVGTARLAEQLMEHIHLENNVLFPRFEAARSQPPAR